MSERYENTETGIFGQNDSIGFKEIEQTSIFQQQTLLQPLGRERQVASYKQRLCLNFG
jgi:hypothetical protein